MTFLKDLKPIVMMNKKYRAIIFDLDGTLVESKLDFNLMREDLGFPKDTPILEHIEAMTCESDISRANEIILKHELIGARIATLHKGAKELFSALKLKNIPMGIQTRNCIEATNLTIELLDIPIHDILTRECTKAKPDPEGILILAKKWNLLPDDILFVGDSHYDYQTAKNANCGFVLFQGSEYRSIADQVQHSIDDLETLINYF